MLHFPHLWWRAASKPHGLGKGFVWSIAGAGMGGMPEAALGSPVPLSRCKNDFRRWSGVADQAAHVSQFFEPTLFIPNPLPQRVDNEPTSPRVEDSLLEMPPVYIHPEVRNGVLFQPLWHPPPPPSPFGAEHPTAAGQLQIAV